MSLSKFDTQETGIRKWQIALSVGGAIIVGAGFYYYYLNKDSQTKKRSGKPKSKPPPRSVSEDKSVELDVETVKRMTSLPAVRKKKNKFKKKESLPLPISPLLEHGIGTVNVYRGFFRYGYVAIHNLDHAKALWENGYFGNGFGLTFQQNTKMNKDVAETDFPNEILHMTHEEALFLSYCLGVLILTNEEGNEMTIDDMWSNFCSISKYFPAKYAVYHHMRCKGWIVKSGIEFGADWLLYPEGPPFCHSQFMVCIQCLWEDTLEDDKQLANNKSITLLDVACLERLSNHVGKGLLLVQVLRPRDLADGDLANISCLKRFKIHVGLAQHWTPGMELPKFDVDSPSK